MNTGNNKNIIIKLEAVVTTQDKLTDKGEVVNTPGITDTNLRVGQTINKKRNTRASQRDRDTGKPDLKKQEGN